MWSLRDKDRFLVVLVVELSLSEEVNLKPSKMDRVIQPPLVIDLYAFSHPEFFFSFLVYMSFSCLGYEVNQY